MTGKQVVDGTIAMVGFQQITDLSSSESLTVPTGATMALIQAEDQNVRWRPDGSSTAPTASVGIVLEAGKDIFYTSDLSALRFIEEATSAKLNVAFYDA